MNVVLSCIACTATEATCGRDTRSGTVISALPPGWSMAPPRSDAGDLWPSVRSMLWAVCPSCRQQSRAAQGRRRATEALELARGMRASAEMAREQMNLARRTFQDLRTRLCSPAR